MKKIKIIALVSISTFLLSACGSKYQIDISEMPEEQKTHHEEMLQGFLNQYESAENDQSKIEAASEAAGKYMILGDYAEAMKFYKEVLEYDEIYFLALNNLAVMYERVGEKEKALEYELRLYENNKTNSGIVMDAIRLLVENNRYDDAIDILTAFSVYDKETGPNYTQIIGDQFGYIMNSQSE